MIYLNYEEMTRILTRLKSAIKCISRGYFTNNFCYLSITPSANFPILHGKKEFIFSSFKIITCFSNHFQLSFTSGTVFQQAFETIFKQTV